MPNLKGIGLQNFRTFKDYEYLEFAPITLITGANNSGKSSIFKAIMLLKENFKDGLSDYDLDYTSFKHELGDLERVLNYEALNKIRLLEKNNTLPDLEQDSHSLIFSIPIELENILGEIIFDYKIFYLKNK